jgi:hypothetical protein
LKGDRSTGIFKVLSIAIARSNDSVQWHTAPQYPEHTGRNRAGFPLHAHCSPTVDNF